MPNKYNVQERKIARKITQMISQQRVLRKKWLLLDINIQILKSRLNGKYGKKKKGIR